MSIDTDLDLDRPAAPDTTAAEVHKSAIGVRRFVIFATIVVAAAAGVIAYVASRPAPPTPAPVVVEQPAPPQHITVDVSDTDAGAWCFLQVGDAAPTSIYVDGRHVCEWVFADGKWAIAPA